MIIEDGTPLIFTEGAYSDYKVLAYATAIGQLNMGQLQIDFIRNNPTATDPDTDANKMFIEWLSMLNLIDVFPSKEINMSRFSTFNFEVTDLGEE